MKEKHIWIIIFLRLWVLYITKISFKRSKIIFHSQNMFFFFYSKNICWWHHHPLSCPNWIPGSHPWLRPFPHFPPQQSQVPLNLPTVCFSASLPHFSPQGSCLQLPHQSTTVVAVVPYLEPCLWSLPPIHLPHRMIYLEQEYIFQSTAPYSLQNEGQSPWQSRRGLQDHSLFPASFALHSQICTSHSGNLTSLCLPQCPLMFLTAMIFPNQKLFLTHSLPCTPKCFQVPLLHFLQWLVTTSLCLLPLPVHCLSSLSITTT